MNGMVCSTKETLFGYPGDLFMPGSTCAIQNIAFDGKWVIGCIAAKIQCHFAPNYPASRIVTQKMENPDKRQSELRKN